MGQKMVVIALLMITLCLVNTFAETNARSRNACEASAGEEKRNLTYSVSVENRCITSGPFTIVHFELTAGSLQMESNQNRNHSADNVKVHAENMVENTTREFQFLLDDTNASSTWRMWWDAEDSNASRNQTLVEAHFNATEEQYYIDLSLVDALTSTAQVQFPDTDLPPITLEPSKDWNCPELNRISSLDPKDVPTYFLPESQACLSNCSLLDTKEACCPPPYNENNCTNANPALVEAGPEAYTFAYDDNRPLAKIVTFLCSRASSDISAKMTPVSTVQYNGMELRKPSDQTEVRQKILSQLEQLSQCCDLVDRPSQHLLKTMYVAILNLPSGEEFSEADVQWRNLETLLSGLLDDTATWKNVDDDGLAEETLPCICTAIYMGVWMSYRSMKVSGCESGRVKMKPSHITVIIDEELKAIFQAEISASEIPPNLQISIYGMRLEEDIGSVASEELSSRKADHLLSDAVFLVSQTTAGAAEWYLRWLQDCHQLYAVGQVKPTAYIHCVGVKVTLQGFHLMCSERAEAFGAPDNPLMSTSFRDLVVISESMIAPVEDLVKAMNKGLNLRNLLHVGWSWEELEAFRAAYIRHLRAGKRTIFRVERKLPKNGPLNDNGRALAKAFITSNLNRLSEPAFIDMLASYLGQRCGILSVVANCQKSGTLRDSYRRRFKWQVHQALMVDTYLKITLRKHLRINVLSKWSAWTRQFHASVSSNATSDSVHHLNNIRKNASFLRKQEYGGLFKLGGTGIQCSRRGSILSLDGGGVKGLIQLVMLSMLEQEIGLDLPLRCFFDLIVGTSIAGGMIALGLGVKKWSVDTCQEKLTHLSRKIFANKSKVALGLAKVTGGWSSTLSRAFKVYWYDCIYDGKLLESVLHDAFGADETLTSNDTPSVKVAVTATTGSAPPCAIFTNYDKSRHPKERAYGWPDRDTARAIKVWEAARCTSAAPFYFAEKLLFGAAFHDGGMLHNNPSAIASREGSLLWDCPAGYNFLVSVGCGDLQTKASGSTSFSRLWNAFAHKLSPAKEEDIRALWGTNSRNYERLDPKLDIPDVPLDDLDTMLDRLPAIKASIMESEALKAQVRRTAWSLVAATFYADDLLTDDLGTHRRIHLTLKCRLGTEAGRVWRKWPGVYICVDGFALCMIILHISHGDSTQAHFDAAAIAVPRFVLKSFLAVGIGKRRR
ncbi:hypothetical protein Q7P37_009705 [Cladosporium fusiforme]